MSSYLSNLLAQTTSRYNYLRRTLLSSEDDGDTEDDTHICRVLRAYYKEKGGPLPGWLPPDPNDRKAVTPQPYAQPSGYFTGAGAKSQLAAVQNQHPSNQRGSLSDLWDPPAAPQPSQPMQPQSLRNARRPMNGPPMQSSSNNLTPPQARPLPSQRAGSYQSMTSQSSGLPSGRAEPAPGQSGGGMVGVRAQDRLRAKIGITRSQSPQPGQGGQGSYEQPAMSANAPWTRASNPYDAGNGSSGQRYGRTG